MKLKVLLLEDDHIQRANVREAIENAIDSDVVTQSTEWEFQRDFETVASDPPQIAVLDIMLRWSNPARDMPPAPPEVTSHPEHAGLRCATRLLGDERTRHVKVILYSVLDKDDLGDASPPEGTDCLVKELDYQNLLDKLKALAWDLTPQPESPHK